MISLLGSACAMNRFSADESLSPKLYRFAVYYGLQDDAALADYEVLVLDSDFEPALVNRYRARFKLGYLSLGEVHSSRGYAGHMEKMGLLLSGNPNWEGARYVELRDPRWKARVVNELIPGILASGFNGIFLDTLDSAEFLESSDPGRFKGMTDAAADVVKTIRARFPRITIMVNRGYAVMPKIAQDIDMLLGESVCSTFEYDSGKYVRVKPADIRWQLDRMQEARRVKPSLQLFSLDYWDPADSAGVARIYEEQIAQGFSPYVATIDLRQIVPRP
jgi:uncharacterized protein (TIGR01370 family)